jgi:hypothetical protein
MRAPALALSVVALCLVGCSVKSERVERPASTTTQRTTTVATDPAVPATTATTTTTTTR